MNDLRLIRLCGLIEVAQGRYLAAVEREDPWYIVNRWGARVAVLVSRTRDMSPVSAAGLLAKARAAVAVAGPQPPASGVEDVLPYSVLLDIIALAGPAAPTVEKRKGARRLAQLIRPASGQAVPEIAEEIVIGQPILAA